MMQSQFWQSGRIRQRLLWVGIVLAVSAACSRAEKRSGVTAENRSPAEQRYPLRGEIVAVNPDRKSLTISHEDIPGFMPAMTMEFRVSDGDLAIVKPGEHIRAELVRQGDDFHLEKIWPDDRGVHINAHGGGVLFHGGRYYWFGEHKIAGAAGNIAHVGVHAYSSADLYNWKDEGIALAVSDVGGLAT